ncbi:MAG: hypothetical protein M3Y07_18145, partial [Acidobacteriota bacterium]|nr:hypothetical protein [Acidobacteriota bacterium]
DEMHDALAYVGAEAAAPREKLQPEEDSTPWEYGMGRIDEKTGRVDFKPFHYFAEQKWQPGSIEPLPALGSVNLSAKGGAPPDDSSYSVVRRWTSPVAGVVEIGGTVAHKLPKESWGDGVRARIFDSRTGKLAEQSVKNGKAEMSAKEIRVEPGDTIDFAVDCVANAENDDFTWTPVVKLGDKAWDAAKGFRGSAPIALSVWEKYAQVLLETNEFAFVD